MLRYTKGQYEFYQKDTIQYQKYFTCTFENIDKVLILRFDENLSKAVLNAISSYRLNKTIKVNYDINKRILSIQDNNAGA